VRPFSLGERGRRRGGSTMPEADNTGKSDAVAGEAEGGSWRSKMTKENWIGKPNAQLNRTTD
jgi:hypothetical protein